VVEQAAEAVDTAEAVVDTAVEEVMVEEVTAANSRVDMVAVDTANRVAATAVALRADMAVALKVATVVVRAVDTAAKAEAMRVDTEQRR